jgi:hypothetical protein
VRVRETYLSNTVVLGMENLLNVQLYRKYKQKLVMLIIWCRMCFCDSVCAVVCIGMMMVLRKIQTILCTKCETDQTKKIVGYSE